MENLFGGSQHKKLQKQKTLTSMAFIPFNLVTALESSSVREGIVQNSIIGNFPIAFKKVAYCANNEDTSNPVSPHNKNL